MKKKKKRTKGTQITVGVRFIEGYNIHKVYTLHSATHR